MDIAPNNSGSHKEDAASLLDLLNETQRHAVVATEGPVLVLAGAGTGKTRTLTVRIAHLIAARLAYPGQILAVTFTNKAAAEMSMRIGELIDHRTDGLWFGTFHAIGARILRRHAELAGLKPRFVIANTDDQLQLAKQVLEESSVDNKRWPARELVAYIQRWKDKGWMPDQVPADQIPDYANGSAVTLYHAYQALLQRLNVADFGDLLLLTLELFQRHPDVLANYHRMFRYILVDEYQDSNVAQYLWLRLLAQASGNICCVGDDDQSIYGWRGAEVGNILRFETDYPGATVVRLERNYRSTRHILGAASGLISNNQVRLGKTLWTDTEFEGEGIPVQIRPAYDDGEEARTVANEIERLQSKKVPLEEIGILVRAGHQFRAFEERFSTLDIPYRIVGGLRYFERAEIRDTCAYLRLVSQPHDDLAFQRIVNKPKRGVGPKTLQQISARAFKDDISCFEATERLSTEGGLSLTARKSLKEFIQSIWRWRSRAGDVPLSGLTRTILDESGYEQMCIDDNSVQSRSRVDNLRDFVSWIDSLGNLAEFLDHVSLTMDADSDPETDRVNLMTLHSAKGLEFRHVFLPGWEESVFPNWNALNSGGNSAVEEERRLAYVGITRARQTATILYAGSRFTHGQRSSNPPSRFLNELPMEHVEYADSAGFVPRLNSRILPDFGGPRRYTSRHKPAQDSSVELIEDDHARISRNENRRAHLTTLKTGARIFHDKFGYGRIINVDGKKLEIDFEHTGTKKILAEYVQPA